MPQEVEDRIFLEANFPHKNGHKGLSLIYQNLHVSRNATYMHAFIKKSAPFLGCANIVYINSCLLQFISQYFKINLLCQLPDCLLELLTVILE